MVNFTTDCEGRGSRLSGMLRASAVTTFDFNQLSSCAAVAWSLLRIDVEMSGS